MSILHHKLIFGQICYFPARLGVIPLKWDPKNHCLVHRRHKTSGLTTKRKLYIQYLVCILMWFQGFHCFVMDTKIFSLSFTDKIVYFLLLFGFFMTILLQFSCVFKASSQHLYINQILKFSKIIKKSSKQKSIIKKLDLLFAACLTPSVVLGPFLVVYGLHWLSPCKPQLVGYHLIPECSSAYKDLENTILNFVVKIAIFAINHWAWAAGMFVVGYCCGGFFCLGVLSFVVFLHDFEKMTEGKTEQSIYRSGLFYRKIQILSCLCNEVQQSIVMLAIGGATLVLVFAANAIILLPWNRENAAGLLLFVIVTYNLSFYLLVCVGTMAEIFEESKDVLECLTGARRMTRRYQTPLRVKWRQTFFMSCTPIKFKFADLNFIERLTPLNCIMFAISQTVSVLLLNK